MIDSFAEYLRSQRTLTQAQADAQASSRARFDLTPTDRIHNVTARPSGQGARH